MAVSSFKKADRKKAKLRLALDGPSGSGKTFTALRFALALADNDVTKIAVIDTEHGSAAKYVGERPDGTQIEFDHVTLEDFSPTNYTQFITEAGQCGYKVVVIDSLSHAWEGKGGALEQVDTKANKTGNKFTAWADVTPQHQRMVEAILRSPCHVIATMRSKTEYVLQADSKGKMVPTKIGLKPIQRDGMEYEFDVVCDIDTEHLLKVSKTRCPALDGMSVMKPGASFVRPLLDWLENGSTVDPSFYAVNEADLRTQVAKEAEEENLSPKEKMKRELALKKELQEKQKREAEAAKPESSQPAAAVVPQPESPPSAEVPFEVDGLANAETPQPAVVFATAQQVEKVNNLFARDKTPIETQIAILQRRGIEPRNGRPHPELLSMEAAAELITKLEDLVSKKVAEQLGMSPEFVEKVKAGELGSGN